MNKLKSIAQRPTSRHLLAFFEAARSYTKLMPWWWWWSVDVVLAPLQMTREMYSKYAGRLLALLLLFARQPEAFHRVRRGRHSTLGSSSHRFGRYFPLYFLCTSISSKVLSQYSPIALLLPLTNFVFSSVSIRRKFVLGELKATALRSYGSAPSFSKSLKSSSLHWVERSM